MKPVILLSTAYLPPVQYLSKFLSGNVFIENDENYIKQTYRNRCIIAGPNGLQTLVVPVKRGSFHKTHIRDIEIEQDLPWINNHLTTLKTAYQHSPFYEYYIDYFRPAFTKKTHFLLDLNTHLLKIILQLTGLSARFSFTGKYYNTMTKEEIWDYRETIHPKKIFDDPLFEPVPYHQVFDDRYPFQPNLSIIDLLFNEGSESLSILRRTRNKSSW